MNPCPEYQERVYMDVLDELSKDLRDDFEEHLRRCAACRNERDLLRETLGCARRAEDAVDMPSERAAAMSSRLHQLIRRKPVGDGWRFGVFGKPARWIPLMAIGSLFLAVVSITTLNLLPGQFGGHPEQEAVIDEAVPPQDLEVIRNLGLLEEMDALEKVVHVVDRTEGEKSPVPGNKEPIQGMMRHVSFSA